LLERGIQVFECHRRAIRAEKETTYVNIAFLGLGQMGSAVAGHLLAIDSSLTVWNRSPRATEPLVQKGAHAASSPSEAVADADVVLTMFTDDDATRSVVLGENGVLGGMKAGAVHISLGTISVDLARELTEAHRAKGQEHVGSPVFGRPNVAADGKLWLAIAGKSSVVETVRPVLQVFSRGISVVGEEPWQAHALKLGGNFLVTATIQMLSEAFVYAEAQGIDPSVFLETVNSALFQSQFVGNYGKTMLNPPDKPGATVSLGIKDTALFREAAAAKHADLPLGDYLAGRLNLAKEAGWQDEDWAVGQYKVARRESMSKS
jgi:3-hydroxyisobutyrate dehydrogenase-like beta-hydroxyacid dehydrogenase